MTRNRIGLVAELLRFGFVGGLASAVHFVVATLLFWYTSGGIFAANAVAFAVAFVVSFVGHRRLTFRASQPDTQSLPRFAAVAAGGFVVNNASLAAFTWFVGRESLWGLALAIVVAAAFVYLTSKFWAFAG